jgi:tetratricopeptide (TPR) repeat protein
MSDPLRTDSSRAYTVPAADARAAAEREAKIEHLLLVGLDHYFAAQYEQAIHVWTRALFLDRSHARARAYIDRARSALAERQRQSEELLQSGAAAFERGDIDDARRLLQAAVERGAPIEDASPFLDRLSRLDAAAPVPVSPPFAAPIPAASATIRRTRRALRLTGFAALLITVAVGGAYAAAIGRLGDWRAWWEGSATSVAAPPMIGAMTLAPPTRGEMALERARALAASGRLHDALSAIESVRATDPQKAAADRLRSEIQRQLLDLGRQP